MSDFLKHQKPRITVFIDAGNLWGAYKILGKMIDFDKLGPLLSEKFGGEIIRMLYYVAYPEEGTREKNKIDNLHKFLTYLKKRLGYEIVKKPLKIIHLRNKLGQIIYDQVTGEPQIIEKGNMDVEMTIDVLKYQNEYDIAVFLTGDSDFLKLVEYLHDLKTPKKVYIFSCEGCISHELKMASDEYYDLRDFPDIHRGDLKKIK